MMRLRPRGLRFRVTAALVAVAAVPLLATGLLGLYVGLRSLRAEATTRNLQLARAIAGEIGRAMERERFELAEVADHLETEPPGVGVARLERALAEARGRNPNFARLSILDRDGRVVTTWPPDPDAHGTDASRLPYVVAARASGAVTWSSALVMIDTGEPKVALVMPRARFVLLAYVELAQLFDAVAEGGRGEQARSVALLDREGTFLAHQDPSLPRERVGMLDRRLVRGAVRGDEGTEEYTWRGRRWLGSAVPVAPTGWVVLVAEPVEQAFAAALSMRVVLGGSLLLWLAVAAALGLVLTRRLVLPIEALSRRAREVAAGRYDQAPGVVPGTEIEEIGELTRSFASMAGEVRAREEALARSEREVRALVENAIAGILRVREDGTFLFANPGFARIVGAERPGLLVGRSILPMYLEPDQHRRIAEAARGGGRVANLELGFRALDGTERVLLVNVASDAGILTMLVVDLTDLRRAAADRARLEDELRHSQKMEAVGRLAGGVAHDFNNLLTAIIGFAGLLEDVVPVGTEDRASLDGIRQSALRASHLTQSLLAFSRKQVLRRRRIDLCEVVVAVEKLLRRIIGEDVVLAVSLPPEPLVVEADPGQLEQVLVNLATNARDAMPGGGSLGIAADAVELGEESARGLGLRRGGRFVRLTVEDSGHGIPPDVRERVFDPFFTTKPAGKGTGLGLSIVDGIVRQHFGHVAVESTVGRGSTFTILLEREDAVVEPAEPAAPAGARPGGRGTILLAEDEPLVRRAFRRTLERAGYAVVEAEDGDQAVERFAEAPERFDLCLVDMVMPRRNGRETAAAIRALRADVPVLLASGYASDVLADRGHLHPGEELVTKPIEPAELLARIGALLEARTAMAEGAPRA